MGLFSFKKKKNVLDILGLTIDSTLENKLTEASVESNFTDFEVNISEKFGLFDKATFRIFGGKKDVSGLTSFNLILENTNQSVTIDKIQNFVDTFSREYGNDRTGKSKWQESEANSLTTYWEGREWILDLKGNNHKDFKDNCIQVNFHFDTDEGISLSLLGANQIVKK